MATSFANPLLAAPIRSMPRSVAIIGAGTIGPDIGYYLKSALPDLKLYLVDISQPALDRALRRFGDYTAKAVAKGKMSEAEAAAVTGNVVGTVDYADIAGVDWVLEAATEDLALKRRIFAAVEAVVRPDALITSNTSSLPAAQIYAELRHPERATVTHFFAPAWRNPVVEVVRWEKGDPALVEYLRWVFCSTGNGAARHDDVACFMLDRIFDNWCNESALLPDRATAAEIDSVAGEFVHAGPFFVLNLANGNPIITETNTLQADVEGEHYRPAPVFCSVERWLTVAPGKSVDVARTPRGRCASVCWACCSPQSVDILDREIGEPADLDFGCGRRSVSARGARPDGAISATNSRPACSTASAPSGAECDAGRPLAAYQRFLRHVLVDDLDGVKLITRPAGGDERAARRDDRRDPVVIREFENDPQVTGFVIVGYGKRAFCAGADIGRFPRMLGDAPAAAQYARDCSRLLAHLDRMKKPVVAALNGMVSAAASSSRSAVPASSRCATRGCSCPKSRSASSRASARWSSPTGAGPRRGPVQRDAAAGRAARRGSGPRTGRRRCARGGLPGSRAGGDRPGSGACRQGRRDSRGRDRHRPARSRRAQGGERPGPQRGSHRPEESAIREAAAAPTLAAALEVGYRAFGESACTAAACEGITAFQEKRAPDFTRTA